ncbi:MAG: hypothetical protein HY860_00860 [Chlamydiales bacterium]|nr:hypothetical protein [Chlamydiales bacterium]
MVPSIKTGIHGWDLKIIYGKYKKPIWFLSFFSAVLATGVIWKLPHQYEATAMFKDGGIVSREKMGFLSQLMGIKMEEADAKAIFYSRTLLEPLIREFGLQVITKENMYLHNFYLDIARKVNDTIVVQEGKAFLEKSKQEVIITGDRSKNLIPIKIKPIDDVLRDIRKSLIVKEHPKNAGILKVYFTHSNPLVAQQFINQLMDQYRAYLKKENESIVEQQLEFLKNRQQSVMGNINQSLLDHANYLEHNMGESGFFAYEEIIAQNNIRQKELTQQIHQLLLEKNTLLSLHGNQEDRCIEHSPIKDQLLRIQEERQKLSAVRNNTLFFLSHHPKQATPIEKKKYFILNLIIPRVKQEPIIDKKEFWMFGGIDYAMAKTLTMQYQSQLDAIHQLVKKYEYILTTITQNPFALASFGSSFTDDTIKQMIESIIEIIQKINKESFLSDKEKELLTTELQYKQKMVIQHLQHLIHFAKLEIAQDEEHNLALQQHVVELLDQELAMLSKQYNKQIQDRLHLITDQIDYLQKELLDEREKMQHVPVKWLKEQQLNIETELESGLLKAIVDTLESKNAEHLMMRVLAKPIDMAVLPIMPKPKYLPIVFIVLSLFFLFFYFFLFVGYRMRKGLLINDESLSKMGFVVIWKKYLTSSSLEQNMLASRQIANQLKKVTLWCETELQAYMDNICKVLKKEGKDILIIDGTFSSSKEDDLIYSIENNKPIQIGKCPFYDLVVTKQDIYGLEFLKRKDFFLFLDQMRKKYDHIFILTNKRLQDPQAIFFEKLSDGVVVLGQEKYKEYFFTLDPDKTIVLV